MDIGDYLDQVRKQYDSGHATESSYRPALHELFQSIDPALAVINEPKKSEGGMPDFLFQRGDVPFGWAEAKNVDKDVIKLKGYSIEQRKRYEKAYPNLIYTNGVDFEFIREGKQVHFVSIASFLGHLGGLQPLPDRFDELERQLKLFAEQKPISIRSAARLAEMMAAKAAIIKDEIGIALADEAEARKGLEGQYKSFKANLLPNLTPGEFADLYAETITYGMFAARLHDDHLPTFSRQEALEKLPASNPFLKGLFDYIAGPALPRRLEYIVDDLVQVMRASDPHSLFRDFGKFTARNDPFIHFYEDFLAAYNPKKKKARGVWYTPEPVVDFIVRAVDDVLKTEFGLADGLADTSKVTVDWDTGQDDPKTGKPRTIRKDVHKVQILDPATGTGTFLAKAVQLISDRVKARAPGKWSSYVEEDLLPRLHGFELLMASYAMCHMKLDMMLTETGYKPSAKPPRLSVWLTNALEPAEREVRDLFFQPLADEARGASEVKRQTPIMCVIGNPPYSVLSSNTSPAAERLVALYKKCLDERNIQPLSDDYVKFIAKAESIIKDNGEGVVGFITNNSYLDGRIHRVMRDHLLQTFHSLYIFNLHGSAMRQEITPDGQKDENVFDIMPGVAIIIGVRNGAVKKGRLYYGDIWGSRATKHSLLYETNIADLNALETSSSRYNFFVPKDFSGAAVYERGFSLDGLFVDYVCGIVTARDSVLVAKRSVDASSVLAIFSHASPEAVRQRFPTLTDTSEWQLQLAMTDAKRATIRPYCYRPFDTRYVPYSPTAKGVLSRPRGELLSAFENNLALLSTKHLSTFNYQHAFVAEFLTDKCTTSAQTREASYHFPLYSIGGQNGLLERPTEVRRLNLEAKLYKAICQTAGIDPTDQAAGEDDFRAATGEARPSEVKVFDYIYGVLHSPAYRAKFAEFLKIDFPRIPYPASPEVFRHVSEKGEQLRRLHLMEPAAIGETPYRYEGEGDDIVASGFPKFETQPFVSSEVERRESITDRVSTALDTNGIVGRVHINKDQYFEGVPEIAWNFYIGGYQPAQKWLKDRRGRVLSFEDITHYQRIVKILTQTDRIMREIELPLD